MRDRPTTFSLISWTIGGSICSTGFVVCGYLNVIKQSPKFPPDPTFICIAIPWMAISGAFIGYLMAWQAVADDNEMEREAAERRAEEQKKRLYS